MADVLENVKVNKKAGKYGEFEKKNANALYNDYKKWSLEKGLTPMKFKEWIDWAKNRGLLKKLNADGDVTAADDNFPQEHEGMTTEMAAKAKDIGKTITKIIIFASVVGLIIKYANKTEQKAV